MFQSYKTWYAYDKTPLNARTEFEEKSAESIHQKVTFDAAYGKERVIAHLYLPRRGKQPHQAVVFFPWGDFFDGQRPFPLENPPDAIAFIVRNGRAVLWPVYKGTFERWDQEPWDTNGRAYRLRVIQWYQDLARSVDYLQERSDIDREKLAYYGVSSHTTAIINIALDDRFKVAVLGLCGLPLNTTPEPGVEPIDFAPRVRVPVLMFNSRNDPFQPLETTQKPLYRLLGTPKKDKLHLPYDVPGHSVPTEMFNEEMFSWLDRYLGKGPLMSERHLWGTRCRAPSKQE